MSNGSLSRLFAPPRPPTSTAIGPSKPLRMAVIFNFAPFVWWTISGFVSAFSSYVGSVLMLTVKFGDDTFDLVAEDSEQPLIDLQETFRSLSSKNLLESFHDAQQSLDSALNLFSLGYLPLAQRSQAEKLYWAICRRIHRMAKELEYFPEELEVLDGMLSDTYFCNFSLFQSIPDSWALPIPERSRRRFPLRDGRA